MKSKNQKVVVAMSGGVDSSVAAYLLKELGFDVIGVFMRFWSPDEKYKLPHCAFENLCCSAEARRMAEKTANKLKIPFHILDLRNFFKKNIVNYFIDEYLSGRTPNPCVVCAQKIKFQALFQKARKIFEADCLATGHYARIASIKETRNKKQETVCKLLKGKDKNKDQSYFLYTATQNVLKHFLFPVGDYTKERIRKIAKENKLPSYKRAESQEVCFVPFGNYKDFLKRQVALRKFKKGKIVDKEGNLLGKHQGIAFYTIGQRRGIGIAQKKPLYVVDINTKKNLIIVGSEKGLYKKELTAENVSWISGNAPQKGEKVKAKVRYGMKEQEARIYPAKNKLKVVFKKPQRAITSGQSVVIYKGNKVLGGGVIKKVL